MLGSSVLTGTKADLYLTGEMGHHEVLETLSQNISVILTEHTNSERGFLVVLQGLLEKLLTSDTIVISKVDKDPLTVY